MHVKLLEVRDRNTFIPVIAIEMISRPYPRNAIVSEEFFEQGLHAHAARLWLLRSCGYAEDERHSTILLAKLQGDGTKCWSDPYGWADRTYTVAHEHIEKNWHDLKDGDVVDVEFILGESTAAKVSERFTTEGAL